MSGVLAADCSEKRRCIALTRLEAVIREAEDGALSAGDDNAQPLNPSPSENRPGPYIR